MLVRQAKDSDAGWIYNEIERKCWASWISASEDQIKQRITNFPKGQAVCEIDGLIAGFLSMNMLNFDIEGDWPNFKQAVGNNGGFENVSKDGNWLFFVSMGVSPDFRGSGAHLELINYAKALALERGVGVASCFRPNGFGDYKLNNQTTFVKFEEYVQSSREDGYPIDPWLRTLKRCGVKFLKVMEEYFVYELSIKEFELLKERESTKRWWQSSDTTWECGETGTWYLNDKTALYKESNLAGIFE